MNNIGNAYLARGESLAAEECYGQARRAYMDAHDPVGEANALKNLALVREGQSDLDHALEFLQRARDILTVTGADVDGAEVDHRIEQILRKKRLVRK